jgi:hypothetical protein
VESHAQIVVAQNLCFYLPPLYLCTSFVVKVKSKDRQSTIIGWMLLVSKSQDVIKFMIIYMALHVSLCLNTLKRCSVLSYIEFMLALYL